MPASPGIYTSHYTLIIWHSALSPPVSSEWVSFPSPITVGALMRSSFWTFKARPWTAAASTLGFYPSRRRSAVGQLLLPRPHPLSRQDLFSIFPQTQQLHLEEFVPRRELGKYGKAYAEQLHCHLPSSSVTGGGGSFVSHAVPRVCGGVLEPPSPNLREHLQELVDGGISHYNCEGNSWWLEWQLLK